VENITALDRGLTISWKSDVTSKQDKYLVIYTRNDTGETFNVTTEDSKILVSDLYPGAAYNIQLFAVSHGLRSERHDYFQTVCKFKETSQLHFKSSEFNLHALVFYCLSSQPTEGTESIESYQHFHSLPVVTSSEFLVLGVCT